MKFINEKGGIGGRPIEIVAEDDGTDPKRGAEVVEKLAVHHKVDLIFGTLFSHVVIASAPRAGELKIPYLVVSEGYHVASGGLNRYVFQPGITDVRAQITAVAGWILKNLGKKVTLIFPDYAFGHDHRDFFSRVAAAQGGTVRALIPIPPTETSFTKYFPRVPADTEVLYHVMVGPGVLTFAREMGEHFGARRPQIFGFVDSVEGVDIASPGLEFLEGTYFWEAFPRYAGASTPPHVRLYRERVGINDSGASVTDPKDVSTASHMFGCWETLFVIKRAVEQSGYKRPGADYKAFIETLEGFQTFPEGHRAPAGAEALRGADPPGVRAAGHLQGGEAPAPGRAPDGDRGFDVRARGGLYEAAALGPRPSVAGRRPRAAPPLPQAGGRRGVPGRPRAGTSPHPVRRPSARGPGSGLDPGARRPSSDGLGPTVLRRDE